MSEALLIVDFQHDFAAPDGALSVPGGHEIADRINALAASGRFHLVVATRDWHPPDHHSFAREGGPWPVHCVRGSPGAQLHHALRTEHVHVVVDKGRERDAPGYSAFERTELARMLRERGVDAVTVVGLATDYCVKHTALAALNAGLRVTVDVEAVRAVDVQPGDGEAALGEIRRAGGHVARGPAD